MKKGIILNFKQLKLLDYVLINKIFIILCAFFIAGIIIGSLLYEKRIFQQTNRGTGLSDNRSEQRRRDLPWGNGPRPAG